MKDWTLKNEERKAWITHYKIKDNKIVFYYADNSFGELENNETNIKYIESLMKKQVSFGKKEYLPTHKLEQEDFGTYTSTIIVTGFATIVMIVFVAPILFAVNPTIAIPISSSPVVLGVISAIITKIVVTKHKKVQEDIEMHEMFLENEEELQEIKTYEKPLLLGTDKQHKAKDIKFDINSIGLQKLTLKDMKRIVKNLRAYKDFLENQTSGVNLDDRGQSRELKKQ